MQFVKVRIGNQEREFPVVSMGPKLRIASVSLLGDVKLVDEAAKLLVEKIGVWKPEVLVGPETKVVPLLQKMSELMHLERYVVCRKGIQAYMINPVIVEPKVISGKRVREMAVDGRDAEYLKNKRAVMVDDVVFTGGSYWVVRQLLDKCGASYAGMAAVFKQGSRFGEEFVYLTELEEIN